MLGQPGIEPEQRLESLPRLDRPVGSVGRLATRDEVDERRTVVRRAAVLERRPVARLVVLAPAAGIVVLEAHLPRGRVTRDGRVDRVPDEDAAHLAVGAPIADERLALAVDLK